MEKTIRVAVVDDHPLYRDGVIHTVASQWDMTVVGQGATGQEAIAIACDDRPDVMLLDMNLPGGGLSVVETLAEDHPTVNIVILTVVTDEATVLAALRLGARGYLLKGVGGSELAETVRAVNRHELYVTAALAAKLLGGMCQPARVQRILADPFTPLTERERQIVSLVSEALSNKEIAFKLDLTEKTVKHYLTSILKKLHARNRVEAALMASRRASGAAPVSDWPEPS